MMNEKRDELYAESFEFILKNLDVTTDLVPTHLLKDWLAKDDNDLLYPVSIFLIAYTLFLARKTRSVPIYMEEEKMNALFQNFQILIGLEFLRRKEIFEMAKMKIFDFDNINEEIMLKVDKEKLSAFYSYIK